MTVKWKVWPTFDAAPRPDVVSTTGGEASGPARLGFPGGSDRG
jgi:hypothetical protein